MPSSFWDGPEAPPPPAPDEAPPAPDPVARDEPAERKAETEAEARRIERPDAATEGVVAELQALFPGTVLEVRPFEAEDEADGAPGDEGAAAEDGAEGHVDDGEAPGNR